MDKKEEEKKDKKEKEREEREQGEAEKVAGRIDCARASRLCT